jgi:ketosteroid isomerase-like protein
VAARALERVCEEATVPQTPALEVVQRIYQAFGKGDLAAILELVADDAEWRFLGPKRLPYTGTFRGKDAVARWFGAVLSVDEVLAFEPRELLDAGTHVTVLGWERTAARPSGKVFETEWAHVFTVRDGRVTRFWGMYDNEASLEAR